MTEQQAREMVQECRKLYTWCDSLKIVPYSCPGGHAVATAALGLDEEPLEDVHLIITEPYDGCGAQSICDAFGGAPCVVRLSPEAAKGIA